LAADRRAVVFVADLRAVTLVADLRAVVLRADLRAVVRVADLVAMARAADLRAWPVDLRRVVLADLRVPDLLAVDLLGARRVDFVVDLLG